MYKKIMSLSAVLIAFLLSTVVSSALGENREAAFPDAGIKVSVNGSILSFDSPPIMMEGRTLVPLRAIFEALGAAVEYEGSTGTVTGNSGDKSVILEIGDKSAYINGQEALLDVPPVIVKGRTLVPARVIAEGLGQDVEWDGESKTVLITKKKIVKFDDANLEKVIRDLIKKPSGDIIQNEVTGIESLEAIEKGIKSLEGIQNLKNLKRLVVVKNQISDLTPLKELEGLESLNATDNKISDISPIAGLKSLSVLDLSLNRIDDESIKKLETMSGLTDLSLGLNFIKDVTPLSKLTSLKVLSLEENQIISAAPLKSLINLEKLNLYHNSFVDLNSIKNLDKLKTFYIDEYNKKSTLNDSLAKFQKMENKINEILKTVIKAGMNDYEKELAIHDYIVNHTGYDRVNYNKNTVPEESHQIYGSLIKGTAVCDGYARLFQLLLEMSGISCQFVTGDAASEKGWEGHAWNKVRLSGEYYNVDVTFDDPSYQDEEGNDIDEQFLTHYFFNISDRQLSVDHKWNKADYPESVKDSADHARLAELHKDRILNGDYGFYIELNGDIKKVGLKDSSLVKLSGNKAIEMVINGDYLYYITQKKRSLCRVKLDGTGDTSVAEGEVYAIGAYGDWVYYINKDYHVYMLDRELNGTEVNSDTIATTINFAGGQMFYKTYSFKTGPAICKKDIDTLGSEKILFDNLEGFKITSIDSVSFSFYNDLRFTDSHIYYLNKEGGIYRVDFNGQDKTKITSYKSSDMEILGNWIYFKNKDKGRYYRVDLEGSDCQEVN